MAVTDALRLALAQDIEVAIDVALGIGVGGGVGSHLYHSQVTVTMQLPVTRELVEEKFLVPR